MTGSGPRLALVLLPALAVTGILLVLGLDPLHAGAVACAIGAVAVAVAATADRPAADEPEPTGPPARPPGGRTDVEEVAWSLLDREGRVRARPLARLRAATAGRRTPALDAVVDEARASPIALAELERALRPAPTEEDPR